MTRNPEELAKLLKLIRDTADYALTWHEMNDETRQRLTAIANMAEGKQP